MKTDEELQLAVKALLEAEGNKQKAADALGWHVNTYKDALRTAVRRNLAGDAFGGETPEGYHMGKITQLHTSKDGKSQEWRHLWPDREDPTIVANAIAEAMNAVVPVDPQLPPVGLNKQCVVYEIADLHLGMYSWAKETGENYDLDIAAQQVRACTRKLVACTPWAETAVILNLGDFFHADNNDSRTPKSGNQLDTDSRFDKVLHLGCELIVEFVDLLLTKHANVTIKNMRGNHDPNAVKALTLGLYMRYINEPRVTVDRDPADVWFYRFGNTMIAAHHGDNIKPEAMPAFMAADQPKMWGDTVFRYAYLGHVHKTKKGPSAHEFGGATYEVFEALCAKDAWNKSMGHASRRSMTAITLDILDGEVQRNTQPIWAYMGE